MEVITQKSPDTIIEVKTQHYTFQMKIHKSINPYYKFYFLVGDPNTPCLDGTIILKNNTGNTRHDDVENTAVLNNIKALKECALNDFTDTYYKKHSFGNELLQFISFFINSQFPSIQTVNLTDDSDIYCSNDNGDRLDLLAYYIALYRETWYEQNIQAYMKPKEKYEAYRMKVNEYASKETKDSMTFTDFYKMVAKNNNFALQYFNEKYDMYNTFFEQSQTLPDFFTMIKSTIDGKDKCRFFKGWLDKFIHSKITIDRSWYFDLYPKITVIPQSDMKPVRNRTQKRQRK
jgi:hypothetical protein